MPFSIPPPEVILAILIVIFFAIGLHEYAHCKFADLAGDPTPRMYGRVTLNLTKHFEPVGTIMMVITQLTGYGIGWGRPAPMDPRRMRNPRWDHFAAVLAGPVSNLAQAVLYALVLRLLVRGNVIDWGQILGSILSRSGGDIGARPSFLAALMGFGVLTNLSLAIFNMIPLGPLDGHWLVGDLLPERARYAWLKWQRQYGNSLLLGIVVLSQVGNLNLLGRLIGPPLFGAFRFLTGAPF